MTRFVPRVKMSKRAKREQDSAKRRTWEQMNPVTRKTENKKAYNRKAYNRKAYNSKQSPRWLDDDSTGIVFSA